MRWLHLSDIHYNPKGDNPDTSHMRIQLLRYLKDNIEPVNQIFFTGDFRYAPKQMNDENAPKEAAEFLLNDVGKAVGITNPAYIHVVPGNHDLDRDKKLREIIVNGLKTLYIPGERDIDKDTMAFLLTAFAPFHSFICSLYGEGEGNRRWKAMLSEPHFFEQQKGFGLLSLNTAIICNEEYEDGLSKDKPSLLLGDKWVLEQLLKSTAKDSDQPLIVLAHHGIRCMEGKEESKITTYMRSYGVTLYLCGHNHEIKYTSADSIQHVTVGCIKQESGFEASFAIGELNDVTGDIKISMHSWAHDKWAQNLHWIDGGTLHIENKKKPDPVKETPSFLDFSAMRESMRRDVKRLFSYHYPEIGDRASGLDENILANIDPFVKIDGAQSMPMSQWLTLLNKDEFTHAQIIGEGGMGKTTSLLCLYQRLASDDSPNAPFGLYTALHDINRFDDKSEEGRSKIRCFLLREIADKLFHYQTDLSRNSLDKVYDELRNETKSQDNPARPLRQYVLLLDGFNEVRDGNLKLLLAEEICNLMECTNVHVLLTSRHPLNSEFGMYRVHEITLQKLDDEQIQSYLERNKVDSRQAKPVWELLRSPMMLTVYCKTCETVQLHEDNPNFRFLQNIQTRGELIYNFVESLLAHRYMAENRLVERPGVLAWERWLLQHVLPSIAHKMEKDRQFSLSDGEVRKLISEACCNVVNQADYLANWLSTYDLDNTPDVFNADQSRPNKLEKRVFQYLQRQSALFVYNKTNNSKEPWSFIHQHYRDFFSALHIVSVCDQYTWRKEVPAKILGRYLPPDVLSMVGDILQDYKNAPYLGKNSKRWIKPDRNPDTLHRVVNCMRSRSDTQWKLPLYNIIQIWERSRGGIDGEDFSGVDIRGLTLYPHIHASGKGLTTIFDRTHVNIGAFFPQGHENFVNSAVFSPDGTRIVTVSSDKTARLWDAATGELLHVLQGHESIFVYSAVFSPDGTRIVTASSDRTARLWDAATGELLHVLQGHENSVNSAVFSPDGTRIVTASDDARARILRIDSEKLECIQVFDHRYNPDLEGCTFEGAVFDSSFTEEDKLLLRRYGSAIKLSAN